MRKNLPVSTRRVISIEIGIDGFKVSEGDRFLDRLTWDEMLGQIATMTHPRLDGSSLFRGMATAIEHALAEQATKDVYRKFREPGSGIRVHRTWDGRADDLRKAQTDKRLLSYEEKHQYLTAAGWKKDPCTTWMYTSRDGGSYCGMDSAVNVQAFKDWEAQRRGEGRADG